MIFLIFKRRKRSIFFIERLN
jgi:hypothetical protein